MILYKTTILPKSSFASKLKGDTLFGQICWAIVHTYGEEKLNVLLSNYEEKPFLIVSNPLAKGYFPKPILPSSYLGEDSSMKKENRKKIWLTLQELQSAQYIKARTSEDVNNNDTTNTVMRNSINYKTFTTAGEGFDPYGKEESILSDKDLYFLLDETFFSLEELEASLKMVAQMGYGRDTSIGKGRFSFSQFKEQNIFGESKTFMALSPFVPYGMECKDIFYEPFTRFGKTGASRANTNPFKNPILMADSGAVVHFQEKQNLQFIGKAISNISSYKDVVHQGYSIVLPLKDIYE